MLSLEQRVCRTTEEGGRQMRHRESDSFIVPMKAGNAAAGIDKMTKDMYTENLKANLSAVYEQDFIENSYGFRPRRSCHNALRSLSEAVENNPTNHIVEADIKGFFDNVDQ